MNAPATADLSVLILAKHEATNLRQLLPAVRRVLEPALPAYEVVVVVDPDDEPTAAAARSGGASVVIQQQRGYGAAFREGVARASGRYIAAIDADLSHDPAVILSLWEAKGSAGLLIASRYVQGGRASMPLMRHALSRILNALVRVGLALQVKDVSSGFRLYRREALAGIDLRAADFDVLEEVLLNITIRGWEVREIPFHYRPRQEGRSKARLLAFGWSFLRSFRRMRQLRWSADL